MSKKKSFSGLLAPVASDRPVEESSAVTLTLSETQPDTGFAYQPLSEAEEKRYVELSRTIRQSAALIGQALIEIRDSRLYRMQYSTFEEYCNDEHNFSRRRAYQLIEHAGIVSQLAQSGTTPPLLLPMTESHAAALADVEPERRREVWDEAVALTQDRKTKLTAAGIARANERLTGKPARKPAKSPHKKKDTQDIEHDPEGDFDTDQAPPTQRTNGPGGPKYTLPSSPSVSADEPGGNLVHLHDKPTTRTDLPDWVPTVAQGSFQGQSVDAKQAAIEQIRRAKSMVLGAEIQIQVSGRFILRNELTSVWHHLRGHQAIINETYVDTLSYGEAIELGLL